MKKIKWASKISLGFCLASFHTYEDKLKVQGSLDVPGLKNLTYRPTSTLINPHWVTWLTGIATAYHRERPIKCNTSVFKLSDGGQILINTIEPDQKTKPLVIIIPGLQGSIADHYIQTFIKESGDYQWTIINYRGINLQLSTGIPFSAGDFASFKEPIQSILNQNEGREIYIVGYSLGGNILVNMLADPKFDGKFQAAAAVNPALNLIESSKNCEEVLGGFYSKFFAMGFKIAMAKSDSVQMLKKQYAKDDFEEIWRKMRRISQLEDHLFEPIFGEKVDKNEASGINKIKSIQKTPLMVLKSENDPIIGWDEKENEKILQNSNILFCSTKYGGHIGYYESYLNPSQFQNRPLLAFFDNFRK